MHLILILIMIFISMVKGEDDAIDCCNYEELILKRFSLEQFSTRGGDFSSGELLHNGPQEKELYLSHFFDVSSITPVEYIECEERVTHRSGCWADTFTVQIYSNGIVKEKGQSYDWYLISGNDVNLNSGIEIGDSKERVLEVLGMPIHMFENRWVYLRKAESDPFPEDTDRETIPLGLSFIDDRLVLIESVIITGDCME